MSETLICCLWYVSGVIGTASGFGAAAATTGKNDVEFAVIAAIIWPLLAVALLVSLPYWISKAITKKIKYQL